MVDVILDGVPRERRLVTVSCGPTPGARLSVAFFPGNNGRGATKLAISPEVNRTRKAPMTAINYRTADVDGFNIFYREAGPPMRPRFCCSTASRPPAICSAT